MPETGPIRPKLATEDNIRRIFQLALEAHVIPQPNGHGSLHLPSPTGIALATRGIGGVDQAGLQPTTENQRGARKFGPSGGGGAKRGGGWVAVACPAGGVSVSQHM